MFMKFTSKAQADPELQKNLSKSDTATLPKEAKEKSGQSSGQPGKTTKKKC